MIGQTISHYRIVEKLGAGGMGEVYRAHDKRLGRDVAVKVLPRDVSNDPARLARFDREARTLAALSHPNILAIYDVGTEGGVAYLVTELLEGETLRQRLARERLPWRRSVEIGSSVADGLAAAHSKGIIHRDVKPENVFLTDDGRVKVLDFGLARVEQSRAAEQETATSPGPPSAAGVVLGTMGYMAPEQVRGQVTDARGDIFSLGCLIYEMLAGKRAFSRPTAAETMAAILKDPAPEVNISGVDVSMELSRIVARCLEKNPAERFQSASDLAFHLKGLLAPSGSERAWPGRVDAGIRLGAHAIAVLPFANLSPDAEQEYFCDGITEEIITVLSKLRGLHVVSRNSIMTLKGTHKTTKEIGELLQVSHVLEGSVRKAGNNLRTTAQLIDTATDGHLWAECFTGTLDDVFDIQEKVARAIANALQVKLSPDEQQHLGDRAISDPRVLECYHRARHELLFATSESFKKAIRLLQQGLEAFGDHPLLYTGLAQAHCYAIEFFIGPREVALKNAVEFTRRVEGSSSEYAHALLARIERFTGSQVQAIRHFEDAVAANPSDVDSLWYLSHSYSLHAGKPQAGAAVAERLISVDPLSAANLFTRACPYWVESNFLESLAVFEEMHRREPSIRMTGIMRMQMLARLGRVAEACNVAGETIAERADDAFAQMATMCRHALLGERDSLVAMLTDEFVDHAWNDPECPQWFAGWFALAGDTERALHWLERWVDRGGINYPLLVRGDPLLEPLRREPRFQRLLDRVRPEWERFVPRFQGSP